MVSGSTYALALEGITEGGTVSLRIEGGIYSSGTDSSGTKHPAIYWNGIGTLQVAGGSYNSNTYDKDNAEVTNSLQENQE
jgi:hypothetical protein